MAADHPRTRDGFVAWYRETYEKDPPADLESAGLSNWVAGRDRTETGDEKFRRLATAERKNNLPKGSLQPNYTKGCLVCGATPIMLATGMCGPCSFGEAETAGGNW